MGASVSTWRRRARVGPSAQCRSSSRRTAGASSPATLEHAGDGREEQAALGLGIRRHRRRRPGDAPRERGDEPGQLAAVARDVRAEHLLRRVLDERAERLDPRPVGHGHALGRVPGEDDRALRVQLAGGVDGEAGLADPGLAGDEDRLARPGGPPAQRRSDPLALRRRVRRRPSAGARAAGPGAEGGRWARGPAPTRPRRSAPARAGRCSSSVAQGQERMAVAAAHDADEVGGQDLAAVGARAQAHGLDHGQPEAVAALAGDVAERDADADVERLVGIAVAALDALLQPDGAGDRGGGAAEDGHQAVAGRLDLLAAVLLDGLAQQAEELAPEVVGGGGPEARRGGGRPDEVGDEDRDGLDGGGHAGRPAPAAGSPDAVLLKVPPWPVGARRCLRVEPRGAARRRQSRPDRARRVPAGSRRTAALRRRRATASRS